MTDTPVPDGGADVSAAKSTPPAARKAAKSAKKPPENPQLMPPDSELVGRTCAGEHDAFEPLVRRYSDQVVRFLYHMVGDFQTAEDIAQETFLKAYAHLGRLEQRERFSTWLYSIARHSCLDWIRAKRSGPSIEDLGDAGAEILSDGVEQTPETPAETEEMHCEVVAEMQRMRADYREIILLKHVHELSYKEIGEIVGLSSSAVGEKLSRVRQMLRDRLRRSKPS